MLAVEGWEAGVSMVALPVLPAQGLLHSLPVSVSQ